MHLNYYELMDAIKTNDQTIAWKDFILNGNLDSLSKVYFHYYDQLYSYGLKHTSDKMIIEDTIQNVFLSMINFRKSIGDVKNLTGYLISSFRRRLFLDLNRKKTTVLTEQIQEEQFDYYKGRDHEASDSEEIEKMHLVIKKCISNLTPKQQEIIFLRFQSGISYEEISEMLNISVDSCYKSVYRSINIIREEAEKILGKTGMFLLLFFSRLSRNQ